MLSQRVKRVADKKSANNCGPQHRDQKEGDDVKLVLTIFLEQIKQCNYIDRMPTPTTCSRDPEKFHREYWHKFMKFVEGPWLIKTVSHKQEHFKRWLFRKFSLDADDRNMLSVGWPYDLTRAKPSGNEARWIGFWLSDTELDHLVVEIFDIYEALQQTQHESIDAVRDLRRVSSIAKGSARKH